VATLQEGFVVLMITDELEGWNFLVMHLLIL